MLKRSGSLAIAIIALVSLAAGSAYAQTGKCQGAKMKAALITGDGSFLCGDRAFASSWPLSVS